MPSVLGIKNAAIIISGIGSRHVGLRRRWVITLSAGLVSLLSAVLVICWLRELTNETALVS